MEKPNDFDLNFDLNLDLSFGDEEKAMPIADLPESFENATKEELSELLKSFKRKKIDEEANRELITGTDYWFAAYFKSQMERDTFLAKLELLDLLEDQYLDGTLLAKKLGIILPDSRMEMPKPFRNIRDVDDLILGF